MMSKILVAILHCGKVDIHLPHTTGNHATLCGMDGDDPSQNVQQTEVAVPRGARVTCQECYEIWVVARRYSRLNFDIR